MAISSKGPLGISTNIMYFIYLTDHVSFLSSSAHPTFSPFFFRMFFLLRCKKKNCHNVVCSPPLPTPLSYFSFFLCVAFFFVFFFFEMKKVVMYFKNQEKPITCPVFSLLHPPSFPFSLFFLYIYMFLISLFFNGFFWQKNRWMTANPSERRPFRASTPSSTASRTDWTSAPSCPTSRRFVCLSPIRFRAMGDPTRIQIPTQI